MELNEAIKTYNDLFKKDEIKLFSEAKSIVFNNCSEQQKVTKTFYKSSKLRSFFIEEPYERLTLNSNGVSYTHYDYNLVTQNNDGGSSTYCLGLCKCTKEEIIDKN